MQSEFQSTLPREERLLRILRSSIAGYLYFNPRSHERSDAFFFFDFPALTISIHAPTRGATPAKYFLHLAHFISIHAPTRGATVTLCGITVAIINFNPRSHERSDGKLVGYIVHITNFNPRSHERSDSLLCICFCVFCISIHAPTRGATVSWFVSILIERISIHAPTRGATVTTIFVMTDAQFQSTLPREERRVLLLRLSGSYYFNPRSHERSDRDKYLSKINIIISIHAPTRGATYQAFRV